MNREKYETPYIVELPGDHPADTEHVRYSVSLVRIGFNSENKWKKLNLK